MNQYNFIIKKMTLQNQTNLNSSEPTLNKTNFEKWKQPGDKKEGRRFVISLVVSVIMSSALTLLISLIVINYYKSKTFETLKEELNQVVQRSDYTPSSADEAQVIEVVKKARPAVVSIIISKNIPVYESNPFYYFFFGEEAPAEEGDYPYDTQKQEIGGGSGFIVSPDGYVVTNKHVVFDEEAEYTIITNDNEKYNAKILDRDPINDIAVLKIIPNEGKSFNDLPYLEMGDSDQLVVGQSVIAIGNSLGEFTNTVSKGIVSGLMRSITAYGDFGGAETLSSLIQTDAAINSGNSGGPLLNLKGEVVGVNVARSDVGDNVGFALPINSVKPAISSVKKEGKIVRPYLGIRYVMNNQLIQEKNSLPYDYGALILRGEESGELAVIPGSPADKAGIGENDLILEIAGKKVDENNTPAALIVDKKPGDKLKMKVWSKGTEKNVEVVLEER